jgi:hypothetical protein
MNQIPPASIKFHKRYFYYFAKVHEVIRNSRYSASVVNTGGKLATVSLRLAVNLPPNIGSYNFPEIYIDRKFATVINKAGGNLATGVNDTDK